MIELINKYVMNYINNETPINLPTIAYDLYTNMIDDLTLTYYSMNDVEILTEKQQELIGKLQVHRITLLTWHLNNENPNCFNDYNNDDGNKENTLNYINNFIYLMQNLTILSKNRKHQYLQIHFPNITANLSKEESISLLMPNKEKELDIKEQYYSMQNTIPKNKQTKQTNKI